MGCQVPENTSQLGIPTTQPTPTRYREFGGHGAGSRDPTTTQQRDDLLESERRNYDAPDNTRTMHRPASGAYTGRNPDRRWEEDAHYEQSQAGHRHRRLQTPHGHEHGSQSRSSQTPHGHEHGSQSRSSQTAHVYEHHARLRSSQTPHGYEHANRSSSSQYPSAAYPGYPNSSGEEHPYAIHQRSLGLPPPPAPSPPPSPRHDEQPETGYGSHGQEHSSQNQHHSSSRHRDRGNDRDEYYQEPHHRPRRK